jgi:S-adenosylmethionine decarboxylase proenzyme
MSENPPVKRYAVDVRLFLATITTAMTIAFGIGVSMGPSPPPAFVSTITESNPNTWQHLPDRQVELKQPREPDVPDSEHQPAGQHLLVDIKSVDSDFLDSEERLAKAMVDAVKAGGLTLLSYHCHSLIPAGVSCVGVLLESHISFHTWPEEGVITLDLFTCGPKPLLPLIPKIEELFGVGEAPVMQWSHELRGFRHNSDPKSPTHHLENDSDLAFWVLSPLDLYMKEQVYSGRSKYQQIDIWDILELDATPSYEDALRAGLEEGDPRWLTPEVATPDRLLFLDGTLQVSQIDIVMNERVYGLLVQVRLTLTPSLYYHIVDQYLRCRIPRSLGAAGHVCSSQPEICGHCRRRRRSGAP